MKTNLFKSALFFFLLAFSASILFTACKDDDDDDKASNEVKFTNIALTGAQEVPAVTTNATGTFNGTYKKDTNMITYTITWTGINPNNVPTNMHFHKGAPTVAGPAVIPIPGPYTSPLTGTTRALTDAEEADLLNGLWYVNIHSSAFPTGELRGQLTR